MDAFLLDALRLQLPAEDKRQVFAVPLSAVSHRYDPHFDVPKFVQIQRMLAHSMCEPLGRLAKFSSETWKPEQHSEPTFRYIENQSK